MLVETDTKIIELGFDITEHTKALLAYWDKDLICKFANNAYLDWFGISPADMIGKMHIRDVLGPLYQNDLIHINTVLNGRSQIFECDIRVPSGQIKRARTTYFPDLKNGAVKGFYVHVADVSPLNENHTKDRQYGLQNINSYLYSNDKLLEDVVKTLESCILHGFPGIANLSKRHFISESKLKRDFKSKYKTTIFSFYRELQMKWAHPYLEERKCTRNQLAVMLNFSNPSNFSSCYQKYLKRLCANKSSETNQKEDFKQYKRFIEQAPVSIAILNLDLEFIIASQQWMNEYHINNQPITGRHIFSIFPGAELKYKNILMNCLKGDINVCEERFFEKLDGSLSWLRWDIRPWYDCSRKIGGVSIFTEDISALKNKIKPRENLASV